MQRTSFHFTFQRAFAALTISLVGMQLLAAPEEPPASFVQDETRLFDAAAVEQLSRDLVETHRSTGVSVYIATSSYQEATARNLAQQLVDPWLKDRPGVIITYNRGNGQSGIVTSPELWRRHPADEMAQMLAQAGSTLIRPDAGPERRIQEAARLVIERIRQWDEKRGTQNSAFGDVERRLALWFGGAIAFSGMVVWLVSRMRRR